MLYNEKNKRNAERIFYIIEMLLKNKKMKFAEIQKISDIPKSSLFGLLNELVALGILIFDDEKKCYDIGYNFIQLSYKCISNVDFLKTIDAECLKLSSSINETVHAAVLSGTDITYISKHEGRERVSIINSLGMTLPAHATAIGKSLLSKYSNDELEKLYKNKELAQYTPNTITDVSKLICEVSKVRELGYSTEGGEISLLAGCVSVPIKQNGDIIAAISATVTVTKLNEEYKEYLLNQLNNSKEKIEFLINF